jgi:SAM-dependent methyltransferase
MTATQTMLADAPAIPIAHRRDGGSFRDPSGFVFEYGHHIYRAVDDRVLAIWKNLSASGAAGAWMRAGMLVGTRTVSDAVTEAALRAVAPAAGGFLQHARVPVISYPYEWSPTMLADAGRLTLKLQIALLTHGLALKDATAYNVQFVGAQPVFIDLPSIEAPARADLWYALGQFQRMFTQPLLLHRRRGVSLRGYFLNCLDGAAPEDIVGQFSRWERMLPGVFFDVTLPAWLAARAARQPEAPSAFRSGEAESESKRRVQAQVWNLRRVDKKLARLAKPKKAGSAWSGYTDACGYSAAATAGKSDAIRDFLRQARPATVLDVGCNTGHYALLAARSGARVIAIDQDLACVDAVYRRARADRAAVLPLCVDLANPSPAIGFLNRERAAFLERAASDCVLALAVLHHLHVTANLPLTGIRDLFEVVARKYLVLEFVPQRDPMFARLTRFRAETFPDYSLQRCLEVFGARFDLIRQTPVADTGRTLHFWRRR